MTRFEYSTRLSDWVVKNWYSKLCRYSTQENSGASPYFKALNPRSQELMIIDKSEDQEIASLLHKDFIPS